MKNKNGVLADVLGMDGEQVLRAAKEVAQEPKSKVEPDLNQIEEWLTADLNRCHTLLTAMLTDKELRMQMAQWMHGRIQNSKHKADPAEINKPIA